MSNITQIYPKSEVEEFNDKLSNGYKEYSVYYKNGDYYSTVLAQSRSEAQYIVGNQFKVED